MQANRTQNSLSTVDGQASQSDGQTMCSVLGKDVEKRKLALFATVECQGQAAGYLSFKKLTKWTGFAFPMRLTCKKGQLEIEALDDEQQLVKKTKEIERESAAVRQKVVITTQNVADASPVTADVMMTQSDDSQSSGPTEENKKEEKVEEKKKDEKVEEKVEEEAKEKTEDKKEHTQNDKKEDITEVREAKLKLESKKNEMQDAKKDVIDDTVAKIGGSVASV